MDYQEFNRILNAIGGEEFEAKYQAKGFVTRGYDLQCTIKKKNNINYILIEHNSMGHYTIKFFNDIPKKKFETVKSIYDCRLEDLEGYIKSVLG